MRGRGRVDFGVRAAPRKILFTAPRVAGLPPRTNEVDVLLSLIACFATSPYGEDVIPLEEDLRINLPTDPAAAKTASDPDADWATFYVMTRNVTEDVNGMIGFVLGTVGFVVTLRPTWVDEEANTAMWGPYSDSGLDPVETGLFVTKNEDASYTWTLFQEPPGSDPMVDAVPVAVGEVDPGSRRRDGTGRFLVDFDTAASLDPAVNLVGTFAVEYDYDRDGVGAIASFAEYGVPNLPKINAQYAYEQAYDGAGSMDLAWAEDFTADGVADTGTMRSRWESDGEGRSDARIIDAAEGREVTASECWDHTFARVYWTDSAALNPNEGTSDACVYSDAEYATDASFDSVD